MISHNRVERPLNITCILNNFKFFIRQVYQKEWTQNIKKKKDQNNSEQKIAKRRKNNLHVKKKRRFNFNNTENLLFFPKSNFYNSKFANTYLSCEKLATIFDINTLKLF